MREPQSTTRQSSDAEEVHLLQLAAIPLRHWRWIVLATLGGLFLAILLAIVLPDEFTARTVLVATQRKSALGGNLAALQSQIPIPLDLQPSSEDELVEVIATSRTLSDSMVRRLGLEPERDAEPVKRVRKIMKTGTEISIDKRGAFEIAVSGSDPEVVARIANTYPDLVNRVSAILGNQAAERRRAFLEQQIEYTEADLSVAESQLVEFQRGAEAPQVEEQAKRTVEAASTLQERIMEKEVEVQGLRRHATPLNPRLRGWRLRGLCRRRLAAGSERPRQPSLFRRARPDSPRHQKGALAGDRSSS